MEYKDLVAEGKLKKEKAIGIDQVKRFLKRARKDLETAKNIKDDDGVIFYDELTPIVFNKNKLIGWGNVFLQDNIQKYELSNK